MARTKAEEIEVQVGSGGVGHVYLTVGPTDFVAVQLDQGGTAAGQVACGISGMLRTAEDVPHCENCRRVAEAEE